HPAIKQSALQHLAINFALRRDISHESTRKRVARSRWILYFFNRQRGRAKRMPSNAEGSFAEKNSRTVLAVLHHQRARSHRNDFSRRARQIFLPGQHL